MEVSEILNKYRISTGLNNDTNKDVIFIDCMDSIIYRNCSLDRLLEKWSLRIYRKFNMSYKFLHYYRRQIQEGCMHNKTPINLIYNELAEQCVFYNLIEKERVNDFIRCCHTVELEIELQSQRLVSKTKVFLEQQKSLGRKIYCISDFRLPSKDILLFFRAQGVADYFNDIFSSCEFGKTKKQGDLYPSVLQLLSINPQHCIMLGDNLQSDCINASKYGIKSYWLNKIY